MKKLTSILITIFGLFTMLYAANYNAPSSDFVLIEGGSFTMGSPESEEWREITGKNPSTLQEISCLQKASPGWKQLSFAMP